MTDCVFCEIVKTRNGEGFWATLGVVSFIPLNPVTDGHRLFVSTAHTRDASDRPHYAADAFEVAADWAAQQGDDFNLITSSGEYATQTIFHTHIHYVPRRKDDGLLLPWSNQ